jgi:hypothetical protein
VSSKLLYCVGQKIIIKFRVPQHLSQNRQSGYRYLAELESDVITR